MFRSSPSGGASDKTIDLHLHDMSFEIFQEARPVYSQVLVEADLVPAAHLVSICSLLIGLNYILFLESLPIAGGGFGTGGSGGHVWVNLDDSPSFFHIYF